MLDIISFDNPLHLGLTAGGVFVVLFVLWILIRLWRRRNRRQLAELPQIAINLAELQAAGPPTSPPFLEFYNIPVRLSGLLLAPVGHGRRLAEADARDEIFESLLPGLSEIVKMHETKVVEGPAQVSTRGFSHALFHAAALPGEGGKGTAWSAVAGLFKHDNEPIMAGLLLYAEKPNSIGQIIIQAEHDWLGCLRVRRM